MEINVDVGTAKLEIPGKNSRSRGVQRARKTRVGNDAKWSEWSGCSFPNQFFAPRGVIPHRKSQSRGRAPRLVGWMDDVSASSVHSRLGEFPASCLRESDCCCGCDQSRLVCSNTTRNISREEIGTLDEERVGARMQPTFCLLFCLENSKEVEGRNVIIASPHRCLRHKVTSIQSASSV